LDHHKDAPSLAYHISLLDLCLHSIKIFFKVVKYSDSITHIAVAIMPWALGPRQKEVVGEATVRTNRTQVTLGMTVGESTLDSLFAATSREFGPSTDCRLVVGDTCIASAASPIV